MATDPAEEMKSRIRADLKTAMREQRARDVATLRTLIGAIDNAQAQPVGDRHDKYRLLPFSDASVEVPRRALAAPDLRRLIEAEIEVRLETARQLAGAGRRESATGLKQEALLLRAYLR
jgi:hypothetical protein